MNYQDAIKSIELVARHECCEQSKSLLFPPHKGGEVRLGNITYNPLPHNSWYLDVEDGDDIDVDFCPWCGTHLTQRVPDAGDSGESN